MIGIFFSNSNRKLIFFKFKIECLLLKKVSGMPICKISDWMLLVFISLSIHEKVLHVQQFLAERDMNRLKWFRELFRFREVIRLQSSKIVCTPIQ